MCVCYTCRPAQHVRGQCVHWLSGHRQLIGELHIAPNIYSSIWVALSSGRRQISAPGNQLIHAYTNMYIAPYRSAGPHRTRDSSDDPSLMSRGIVAHCADEIVSKANTPIWSPICARTHSATHTHTRYTWYTLHVVHTYSYRLLV